MTKKSVIFSDSMERKFISLAMNEGIVRFPDGFDNQIIRDRLLNKDVTRQEVSQIHANLFLNPDIKIQIVHEVEFESTVDEISIEMHKDYSSKKEFDDFQLLFSLVMARDPSLTLENILEYLTNFLDLKTKVVDSFGSVPTRQSNGGLVTFDQTMQSAITHREPAKASDAQLSLFSSYEKAYENVSAIERAYSELGNLNRRFSTGDSVLIDPRLKSSFTDVLDEECPVSGDVDKVDLFYLFIKELKTLPIGRNLKETINLANTREGDSLRKRVNELHDLIISGQISGIEEIRKKIIDDINKYKSFTSQLISPNSMSDLTDITLNSTSLIPGVGPVIGAFGLAKTIKNIVSDRILYKEIQENLWANYKGTNI